MPERQNPKSQPKKPPRNKRSAETIAHFACAKCRKWWTIGDAPTQKKIWHCPWCGTEQEII